MSPAKKSKQTPVPMRLTAPKQRQGHAFERHARIFLETKGLICLADNWQRTNAGEIDLIMLEQGRAWDIVVFVEVRQRRASQFGDALASVTRAKQRKIIKTARYFLQQYPQYAECECRFDVIGYDSTPTQAQRKTTNSIDDANEPSTSVPPLWVQGAFMADAW
ncbi:MULTISPECIES: YraN family protein [unclassified Psychrobacter]|uniref:YraN family protein n=1 Tax=unclassified Psychrobacter TaxID=196806 RepID=UPI0018F62A93|nr:MULTISPECIES: YraN family protein [unclassified Psychrobacter]